MNEIYKKIKTDKQIWKFCFYGLLKNLKFFEPYLIIYLMSLDLNLFKIGILYSIREIFMYIFEIPSGVFADNYGKKKELMICFTFYIISFIFFFIGSNFLILSIAMIFFGLGEAFRSGTHKAIIYSYLEQKGWFMHKGFVYGRTRSFSLIGSAISAFLSIIFVLNLTHLRLLFLICIIPYVLDFILITTYPNNLDERIENTLSLGKFFKKSIILIKEIGTNKSLIKIMTSSSLYDSIFKCIKDYIQPILQAILATNATLLVLNLNTDDLVKVYLGFIYGIIYIFSSIASKNVYKLNKYMHSEGLMNIFFIVMAAICIMLSVFIKINSIFVIMLLYFILYILKDARRPLFVDVCGDYMNKNQRATVLSVESQFRALFVVVLAPLFGFIVDKYSLSTLFLIIGISILAIFKFVFIPHSKVEKMV